MVDLNALHRELHRALTAAGVTALARGLTLSRNLHALDPEDAATLATHLVHNFTDRQLLDVGRGGIHALRRAVLADQAERREHALDRLDALLHTLPALHALESDGMWVLSRGLRHGPVTRALPELATTPEGTLVIIVTPADQKTGKAQLCEHYRQCHDELPEACFRALQRGQVVLLPMERAMGRTRTLWSKVRSLVIRVPAWA